MSNPISHLPTTSTFGDARPEGRDTQIYKETTGAAQHPFSNQGIPRPGDHQDSSSKAFSNVANDVHKYNIDSSRSSDPLSQHGIPRPGEHQDSSSKAFADVANDVHKFNIEEIGHGGPAPVSHHIHKENEPLPGARGGAPVYDYSPNAIDSANIPKSELGVKPTTDVSGLAVHDTHAPVHFTAHETHDAPVVGGTHISPYERTVLKSALENSTTDSQEFERNPLKTPDESYKKVPFNVGSTTEERNHGLGGTDHSIGGEAYKEVPYNVGAREEMNHTYGTDSHGLGHVDHTTGGGDHSKHSTTESDRTKPSVGQKIAGTAEKAADQTKKTAQSAVGHKSTGNTDTNHTDHTTKTTQSTVGHNKSTGHIDTNHKDATPTHSNTGMTKPSLGDKIIGATEKLAGKITGNAALQEKGQIKKQGGDATAVPHN